MNDYVMVWLLLIGIIFSLVSIFLLIVSIKRLKMKYEMSPLYIEKIIDSILNEAGYFQGIRKDKLKSILFFEYIFLNLRTKKKLRKRMFELEEELFD